MLMLKVAAAVLLATLSLNAQWFVLDEPVEVTTSDGLTLTVEYVEVTIGPPPFTIPETQLTRELLENRTYYDGYWCSYPEGQEYWYCGPMDGSRYYCKYYPGQDPVCHEDFLH